MRYRNMRKSFIVLFAILTAAASVSWSASTPAFSERIAAVVNGDVILESDLKRHKQGISRSMIGLPLGIIPPGKLPTEKEILDELIVIHLLEQEAARRGMSVDDRGLDASIDMIKKRNKIDEAQFVLFLAGNGLTQADYRKLLKRQMTLTRLIDSEVTQKMNLKDEDAQRYFKANKDKIDEMYQKLTGGENQASTQEPKDQPEPTIPKEREVHRGGKVRLRQITIPMPQGAKPEEQRKAVALAKKIYEEAMTGGDFAKLAKAHSKDNLAKNGGDLGFMEFKDLVPNLQKMVERMKPGDTHPPVGTPNSIIIFHLAEAKNRTTKMVPIPREELKMYEKQLEELRKRRSAQQRKPQDSGQAPRETPQEAEPDIENPGKGKGNDTKDPGILTQAEDKEYRKVRKKVIALMRVERVQERLKEWIDELKKNSIIEVKL